MTVTLASRLWHGGNTILPTRWGLAPGTPSGARCYHVMRE